MNEDLIVLGAPAETQAAGGEPSIADAQTEGHAAGGEGGTATPGNEQTADPSAEPKPEPAKGEGGGDADPEKPRRPSGIQRMQAKIARLEAELASSRSAAPAAGGDLKAAVEREIGAPPKESDFKDYLDFEDAKAEYRIRKINAEERVKAQGAQAATRAQTARTEAVEAFQDRQDEARERIADYDTVLASASDRTVQPHVSELVVESEKGALLAYHLAKNPAELDRLNRMSPMQAAKEVGKLEHRLALAKPKTATAAPKPATPLSGAAAPSADPSKMTFAEYEAWRKGKKG